MMLFLRITGELDAEVAAKLKALQLASTLEDGENVRKLEWRK